MAGRGIQDTCQIPDSYETVVLFKADDVFFLVFDIKSVLQCGDNLFHPSIAWQIAVSADGLDSGTELFCLSLGKRLELDAEIRILIAIVGAFALLQSFQLNLPACFAFHVFDVVKDLSSLHGGSFTCVFIHAVKFIEGLIACFNEVFYEILFVCPAKAFVQCLIADGCIFVSRHNLAFLFWGQR